MKRKDLAEEIQKLVSIMERLRGPEGCPWDREQTLDTLQEYLIEESYETVEAAQKKDLDLLKEELGDVLLQVVFQAQVARERDYFDLVDVIKGISDKLLRRHPHVFSDKKADTPVEVSILWKEIKEKEREGDIINPSIVDDLATNQPALMQAFEIQKIASSVGLDWDNIRNVFEKVKEEIVEIEEALYSGNKDLASLELGDLLFSAVNLARFLGTNPEIALLNSILKFKDRFKYVEESVRCEGKVMEELSLEELDYYWEEAKKRK